MKIRTAIQNLGTYTPPLEGRNPEDYLLMDFNESPFPPDPKVQEALAHFFKKNTHIYPDYGDFLEVLGDYVGTATENLIFTNGSDQAIDIILRCLLNAEDEMVMAHPGFSMFRQIAGTLGCKLVAPEYSESLEFPIEAIKKSVSSKTRLIVVINPNNPTGTSASCDQVEELLSEFPDVAILVDEAYFEFSNVTSLPLLDKYPNLIIIRTFSKALALPSLRLGYAIARSEFIAHLYKIRGPYDVNMAAIIAARTQLKAPETWKAHVHHLMTEAKPALESFFQKHEVRFYKGDANFMLVAPKRPVTAVQFLREHKILVRPMSAPIAHTFRMNVHPLKGTLHFMSVYRSYLQRYEER